MGELIELFERTIHDGGAALTSLILIGGAVLGRVLPILLVSRGARRERRETLDRMLELQRRAVREELRAERAEGVARVLKLALALLVAALLIVLFGAG